MKRGERGYREAQGVKYTSTPSYDRGVVTTQSWKIKGVREGVELASEEREAKGRLKEEKRKRFEETRRVLHQTKAERSVTSQGQRERDSRKDCDCLVLRK